MLTPNSQRRMMEESGKMIVDSSERLGVVAQSLRELVVRPFMLLYRLGRVWLTSPTDLRREGSGVRGGRGPGKGEGGSGGSQRLRPRTERAGELNSRPERRTVPVSLRVRTIPARMLYLTTSSSSMPPLLARGLAPP